MRHFVALFLMPDGCRVLAGPKEKLISLLTEDIAAGIDTDFERCFNHSHNSAIVFSEKLKEFCARAIDSIFRKLQSDAFWDQIRGDYLFWNFLQDCEKISKIEEDRKEIVDYKHPYVTMHGGRLINYEGLERPAIRYRNSFIASTELGKYYDKFRLSLEMGYTVKEGKPRYQMRRYDPLVRKDADVLAKFLWQRLFPTLEESSSHLRTSLAMRQGRLSLLKEAVAGAFKGKEIRTGSLFSVLKFKEEGLNKKFEGDLFKLLKEILEEGDLFSGKFVDMFWRAFGKDSKALPYCRKVVSLGDFFGGYVPFSDTEMAYGLQAFRIYQKREELQTFSEEELSELSRRITCILKNIMPHTTLMTVPHKNEEKVKKTEDFFYRMAKKMEDVRDDADSLLDEYKRFWDPWFWKIEPNLGDDEAKKIFDELNDVKSVERKNPSSTISKPTVLPSRVKDVKSLKPVLGSMKGWEKGWKIRHTNYGITVYYEY